MGMIKQIIDLDFITVNAGAYRHAQLLEKQNQQQSCSYCKEVFLILDR